MTRFGWAVVLCVAVVLVAGIGGTAWYRMHARNIVAPAAGTDASPALDPAALSIYTSGEYGFSFMYPADATVTDAFSTSTAVLPWRVHALGSGTPVVRVETAAGEVRVGVSADAKELAACVKAGPSESKGTETMISSTTWQQFSSEKLGTDEERRVVSYRTLHSSHCYALELLTPLAPPVSTTGYTLEETVTSFTFAH